MLVLCMTANRFVFGLMQDCLVERNMNINMLDYVHHRTIEALRVPRTVILVTSGPAGVQAGEFPCEATGLILYILVPRTSDHLFNLEYDSTVILLTAGWWEMKGNAKIISPSMVDIKLELLQEPGAEWYVLLQVKPCQIQIRRKEGWGNIETIDLEGENCT